jgi:hypothetical protein
MTSLSMEAIEDKQQADPGQEQLLFVFFLQECGYRMVLLASRPTQHGLSAYTCYLRARTPTTIYVARFIGSESLYNTVLKILLL